MTSRTYIVSLLLGVLACTWVAHALTRELATARDLHDTRYVTAAQCARCHPDHAASFRRTFHRTMTQRADPQSVQGNFEGATLDYFGVRATMTREGAAHVIAYQLPGQEPQRFVVEKTVGSRRYQQYLARRGDQLLRLPLAWHNEEQRWFHMNGAFLTPDPALPLQQVDFERHVTRWNDNCVFCHNVAPNPGLTESGTRQRFQTEVAELGIACEACHGPGAAHERANTSPLRRYALHLSGKADPSIVNPARLSPERSLDVCGRCHGQRITDDLDTFLRAGDPFVPGDDLALYSAPLWRDTTLHGEQAFQARFWPDGTPRLTAYEYQGVLQSACAQRGELTCLSCHGMHEGDPRGQIRPFFTGGPEGARRRRQGAAMCTQCHDELTSIPAQRAHAHHEDVALPGCADCHMPRVVYGVLDVHPSHRIERPDPARDASAGRPDACTLCHVAKTRRWASEQRDRLWPRQQTPAQPAPSALSEVETQLFAGDPIERALAAYALRSSTVPQRARHSALLLDVLESDPYPAVRHLALRSLASLGTTVPGFTPEDTPAQRSRTLQALRARLPVQDSDAEQIRSLRPRAEALAIEIGE